MSKESDNGKPDDLVFKIGSTVHGFKLVTKIDEGGFGQVFKVTKDKQFYAMKLESNAMDGGSAIKLEISVLRDLPQCSVFPGMFDGGKTLKYHFLVLELLGDNLRALRMRSPNPEAFSDGTWARLGIQCLYALKKMHDAGYVHRDVKPNNFAIACNTVSDPRSRRIMLFDFGLSRKFVKVEKVKVRVARPKVQAEDKQPSKATAHTGRQKAPRNPRTARQKSPQPTSGFPLLKGPSKERTIDDDEKAKGKADTAGKATEITTYTFRKPRPRTDFRGTEQYASPNAHDLKELGRTDDIWSLLYMIAEFFLELPWTNETQIPVADVKKQCTMLRIYTDSKKPGRLTSGMTRLLGEIDEMLKSRNYYQAPDYTIVHSFFLAVMKQSGVDWKTPYDWELNATTSTSSTKTKSEHGNEWENPYNLFKTDNWSNVPAVGATTPTHRNRRGSRSPSRRKGEPSREEVSKNLDEPSANAGSPPAKSPKKDDAPPVPQKSVYKE